jgi:hypothetical protein
MDTTPRVSIVVTWRRDLEELADMLNARLPHRDPGDSVDFIVVTLEPLPDETHQTYPALRFITAEPDASIEEMRVLGMRHAFGDIVLLLDGEVDDATIERGREAAR